MAMTVGKTTEKIIPDRMKSPSRNFCKGDFSGYFVDSEEGKGAVYGGFGQEMTFYSGNLYFSVTH